MTFYTWKTSKVNLNVSFIAMGSFSANGMMSLQRRAHRDTTRCFVNRREPRKRERDVKML